MPGIPGPNLGILSGWTDGEGGWGAGMSSSLGLLDALVQCAATSRTSTPPGSPALGDRYIVGASPSGAWAGHANAVAICANATGPVWTFVAPKAGWRLLNIATGRFVRWTGSSWATATTLMVDRAEDIQGAINAADAQGGGGYVHLVAGTYDITSFAPLQMKRGVHLVGEGWVGFTEPTNGGPWDASTIIYCSDANKNIIEINNASHVGLRNLEIKGAGSSGTQIGIKMGLVYPNGLGYTNMPGNILENVTVRNCGSHGVQASNCYISTFKNLHCLSNKGDGFHALDVSGTVPGSPLTNVNWNFDNCWFVDNAGFGFWAVTLQNAVFTNGGFQNNAGQAQIYLESANSVTFSNSNFELIGAHAGNIFGLDAIYSSGIRILGGTFLGNTGGVNARGMRLVDSHHCDIDGITVGQLNTSAILLSNGGVAPCSSIAIGNVNMPNQECPVLEGTEGTYNDGSCDFFNCTAKYTQAFKDDATRDHARASGYEQPLKLRGHQIFVGSPTSPPTTKLQVWNGSAWVGIV